jgi:hypothetical protein
MVRMLLLLVLGCSPAFPEALAQASGERTTSTAFADRGAPTYSAYRPMRSPAMAGESVLSSNERWLLLVQSGAFSEGDSLVEALLKRRWLPARLEPAPALRDAQGQKPGSGSGAVPGAAGKTAGSLSGEADSSNANATGANATSADPSNADPTGGGLLLDSLSLVPGSLEVWTLLPEPLLEALRKGSWTFSDADASSGFPPASCVAARYGADRTGVLDPLRSTWKPEGLQDADGLWPKLLLLRYRVLPLDLDRRYARKDRAALDSLGVLAAPLRYTVNAQSPASAYDLGGLDYSGSFSRGLSFGNRQDVVLNSSLNLQLSGRFRDVDIEAALTDNNIPVQPEGNTQQLQEFDQVYIRLSRDPHRLTVGDYEMRRPQDAYFLNLFRRLQGAQYRGRFGPGSKQADAGPWLDPYRAVGAPGADRQSGSMDLADPASGAPAGFEGAANAAGGGAEGRTGAMEGPIQKGLVEVGASVAVARGQYRRQTLIPEEGNQGPYLLQGNNGERFIIVLAGSERVYIDGELLTRGQDYDYVIDYNAGEIIFTPRRIVTKDLRIQVEFEYAERSYFRSLFLTDGRYTLPKGKGNLRWSFYSEQDARNQPVDASLDEDARDALRGAGDSLELALAPAFDTASFSAGRILYRLTDTLGFDSVFVYTTAESETLYQVSFALVGENQGDYVLSNTLANGRVYAWVAPVAGQPQGNYAPVRQVPAPLTRQILSLGGEWQPLKGGVLFAEGALSRLDLNTFSAQDDGDDAGWAGNLGYRQALELRPAASDSAGRTREARSLSLDVQVEQRGERFRPLENYRPIEFARDWNLTAGGGSAGALAGVLEQRQEQWLRSGLAYRQGSGKRIEVRLDRFRQFGLKSEPEDGGYTGWRPSAALAWTTGRFRIAAQGSYLSAQTDTASSSFARPRLDISQGFGKRIGAGTSAADATSEAGTGSTVVGRSLWTASLHGEMDDIRFRSTERDSLLPTSIYYDLLDLHLERNDARSNRVGFRYRLRRDKGPRSNAMVLSAVANEFIVDGGWQPGLQKGKRGQRLSWTLTYRDLDIRDSSLIAADAEQALLGRGTYAFRALDGLFNGDLLYELGTASEPRRNLAYVPVPAGQGQYVWNDYNDNGVQELDEFELAAFADQADFIRVFTPTDEFVRADLLNTQYSISVEPRSKWPSAEGFGKFLTRLSAQSIAQFNRRVLEGVGAAAYWPLAEVPEGGADSNLVSLTATARNTIWFNRSRPEFGMEYSYQLNRGRNLLNGGPEDRRTRSHEAVLRAALGRFLNLRIEARQGERRLDSEAFASRSYTLPFLELEPQLNWQSGSTWRMGIRYGYAGSQNELGVERLRSHEAALDGRWNRVGKSSLEASVSAVLIDYQGAADSPVAFALLEGLSDGTNWLWRLNWDKRLSRFLQLGLQYEGRKTGTVPIAHVGRAQLRAIF